MQVCAYVVIVCRSLSGAVITGGYRIAQNRNGEYKQYCKEKLCSFRKAGCACEFHKVLALRAKELLAARHT